LKSIVFQTYADLEIVCISSVESDEISKILDKYETLDSRIRVYRKKSLDFVIENTNGKYIAFVDSNHWMMLNLYQTFINALNELNQDIDMYIFNGAVYINGQNDILPSTLITLSDWKNHFSPHSIHSCQDCTTPFSGNVSLVNKIYKKEFLLQHIEKFKDFNEYHKDYVYLILFLNAKSIIVTDEVLFRFRIVDAEASNDKNPFDVFEVIDILDRELRNSNLYEHLKYAFFQFKYNTYLKHFLCCTEDLKEKYFITMKCNLDYKLYPDLDFNICQRLRDYELYCLIQQNNFQDFKTILGKELI
ncbi:MAG: glycosyltransferase, partial [Candidatus Gastranaerophilales bacterium]|nr:glycosyltransferase [Candidatus Gastranaerophilales bacterium]